MRNDSLLKQPIVGTRADIIEYLLYSDMNAVELAGRLSINESAVRRHMDTLETGGSVEHYYRKFEKGRPKKMYRLTTYGKALFPERSKMMLTILAEKILGKLDDDEIEDVTDSVVAEISERILMDAEVGDGEKLLESIVSALNEFGFRSGLIEEDGSYLMTNNNCVFRDVSPVLAEWACLVHGKVLEGLLKNASLEQVEYMGKGERRCTHRIRFRNGV